ncbi:uncharacterized protein LOC117124266 [Anneissia japonica]|uniref:uncharacterized protein LOC117124266 n=1 Tax=Anneissia japonica TaxID=1529436 RepID=UPI001425A88E|nr:uncharacterized protein LOC117124266 [Anneissia japonica]
MSFGVLPVIWLVTTVALRPTDAAFGYLSWNNMKIEENRALLGNIFQTLNGIRSRIECQSFCAQTSECKSYNYVSSLKVCELNNAIKEDTNADKFRKNDNYIYATLNYDNACTNKDCCLDPTTNKSKDTYCYIEIELEKEDFSSSSVSVRVIVTAGRVNQITTTCSEGDPSPNIDVVDSENVVVFCNGTRPSNNVTVNVTASYLEILATASVTITTKTSPATLKEQFTNMTAGIASWSLPLDEIADDFNVSCSEGSVALLDKNSTHGAAICYDLVPGSTVIITVNSVTDSEYGMPASLNIQLDPDVVTFTNRTSSLDSISVAWEMRTGFASKFVVNCSSGVPASSVIDEVVGSASIECSCLNPLQIVNVTVIAVANSKQGLPASEIVSTDEPVNISLIEDVATNTSTIVANMTSNAPSNVVYAVYCSAGEPFPVMIEDTNTATVRCIGVEAGQSANLSVKALYGNCSEVGSSWISISTD